VRFAPGETIRTVLVPLCADTLVEGSETVDLAVINLLGGVVSSEVLTINDTTNRGSSVIEISGRVLAPDGRGLRNATVVFTDQADNRRTVTTNSFGYYTIDLVEARETYILRVQSRRYKFASRVLEVTDNLTDVDFVAQE
jgi:hypothetical protein